MNTVLLEVRMTMMRIFRMRPNERQHARECPSRIGAHLACALHALSLAMLVLCSAAGLLAQAQDGHPQDVGATSSTAEDVFVHHYVVANGVRLHYVVVGRGEPVCPFWPAGLCN